MKRYLVYMTTLIFFLFNFYTIIPCEAGAPVTVAPPRQTPPLPVSPPVATPLQTVSPPVLTLPPPVLSSNVTLDDTPGTVVANTAFDVQIDGFSFVNDGDVIRDTWWNVELNAVLDNPGGVCLGMSFFAQRWFAQMQESGIHLNQLEGTGVGGYLAGLTQWTASFSNMVTILASVTGWVPNSFAMEGLLANMRLQNQPIVLGLQDGSGGSGHAVLARQIVETNEDYLIMVYDPNYPGDSTKYITYHKSDGTIDYHGYDRLTWFPYIDVPHIL